MNYNDTILEVYKTGARQEMLNYNKNLDSNSTWSRKLWNQLQAKKRCCGINGLGDYYEWWNAKNQVYPDSCRFDGPNNSSRTIPVGDASLRPCRSHLDRMWIDQRSCAYLEAFGCFLIASLCFLYRKLEPKQEPTNSNTEIPRCESVRHDCMG